VGVPVGPDTNFQPTPANLAKFWDDQTDGLVVASPANPTGTMLDAGELAALSRFTRSRQGHLIVDEIYHGLTYDTDASTALAVGDDLWVVQSFSKYFQMTGWRLGWLVVPEAYLRDVEKLAQNLFIAPSTPAQYAALAAFQPDTLDILEARRAEFHRRRDFLAPALESLGFKLTAKPQGAFYLYCDSSALAVDSFALAGRMIEEAGVAATPGLDFGQYRPEAHMRFAYTNEIPRLAEAVARLERLFRG